MDLCNLLNDKKIIICCGSGGVGKTTISATLAIMAASHGRNTLLMTVDPARRLASALGIESLTNAQAPVPREALTTAGVQINAIFHAMMLDAKHTWDDLVNRYAPNQSIRDKIYNNLIYQNLSDSMSGSQEYMALEKLYEVTTLYNYDLIILDTPPSKNAVDFLKAPVRMTNFISNSRFFQVFLSPGMRAGKLGWKVFSTGSNSVLKILELITGAGFLHDLTEFFGHFESMIVGFGQRAQHIDELIHSKQCSFVLVTSPESPSIQEALSFREKLLEMNLPFWGYIVNRVLPHLPELDIQRIRTQLSSESNQDLNSNQATRFLLDIYSNHREKYVFERTQISSLLRSIDKTVPIYEVPLLQEEVHDLKRLHQLATILVNLCSSSSTVI